MQIKNGIVSGVLRVFGKLKAKSVEADEIKAPLATISTDGLMGASDKIKLNSVAEGATNFHSYRSNMDLNNVLNVGGIPSTTYFKTLDDCMAWLEGDYEVDTCTADENPVCCCYNDVNNGGKVVVLLKDISISQGYEITRAFELHLNGHMIDLKGTDSAVGCVLFDFKSDTEECEYIKIYGQGGRVRVHGVASYMYFLRAQNKGIKDLVIRGGTYEVMRDSTEAGFTGMIYHVGQSVDISNAHLFLSSKNTSFIYGGVCSFAKAVRVNNCVIQTYGNGQIAANACMGEDATYTLNGCNIDTQHLSANTSVAWIAAAYCQGNKSSYNVCNCNIYANSPSTSGEFMVAGIMVQNMVDQCIINNCHIVVDSVENSAGGGSSIGYAVLAKAAYTEINGGYYQGVHTGVSIRGVGYVKNAEMYSCAHGGMYVSGLTTNEGATVYLENCKLGCKEYDGLYDFSAMTNSCLSDFYIGTSSNNVLYMNNCELTGVGNYCGVVRGTDGETGNALYLSNISSPSGKSFRIDTTGILYKGYNCNITTTNDDLVINTIDEVYTKENIESQELSRKYAASEHLEIQKVNFNNNLITDTTAQVFARYDGETICSKADLYKEHTVSRTYFGYFAVDKGANSTFNPFSTDKTYGIVVDFNIKTNDVNTIKNIRIGSVRSRFQTSGGSADHSLGIEVALAGKLRQGRNIVVLPLTESTIISQLNGYTEIGVYMQNVGTVDTITLQLNKLSLFELTSINSSKKMGQRYGNYITQDTDNHYMIFSDGKATFSCSLGENLGPNYNIKVLQKMDERYADLEAYKTTASNLTTTSNALSNLTTLVNSKGILFTSVPAGTYFRLKEGRIYILRGYGKSLNLYDRTYTLQKDDNGDTFSDFKEAIVITSSKPRDTIYDDLIIMPTTLSASSKAFSPTYYSGGHYVYCKGASHTISVWEIVP